MSFLAGPAPRTEVLVPPPPPPPPAPPTFGGAGTQAAGAAQRMAAAAAARGGFGDTVRTSSQGAPAAPTATKQLLSGTS